MVDLQMLVMVGLRGGALAADGAGERSLAGVHAPVLDQIVVPMEGLVALVAGELLGAMMLAPMPHVVVLADELAAAVLARVRLDLLVRVDVVLEVQLAHERLWAVLALEGLGRPVCMHPRVDLEIPFGGEALAANGAIVLRLRRVRRHVRLDGRLGEDLLAHGTLHRFGVVELVGVRQPDVAAQRVGVHESIAAVRTAFGLQVMRLLVPQEARLRGQHLAAVTHVLFLAHHHLGVPLAVLRQIRVALELFACGWEYTRYHVLGNAPIINN